MNNYISEKLVNRNQIPWNYKTKPYRIITMSGESFSYNGGKIDREVRDVVLTIQGNTTKPLTLNIFDTGEHDVVVGHPWLYEYNPRIDWRTGQVEWTDTQRSSNSTNEKEKAEFCNDSASQEHASERTTRLAKQEPQTRQHAVVTKTGPQPGKRRIHNKQEKRQINNVIHAVKKELDRNNYLAKFKEQLRQKKKDEATKDRMTNVPQEYRKYTKLYAENPEGGIPEHSQWDHEIKLIDGKNPTFHRIYNLTETQLETLREYLQENLDKGYIRESTSSAGYPVMFVPKKNGKLRLVVDYRQLNDITVKDRTPLPLITELRDRLHGKKYFTALDLKGAYNLIRMAKGEEWKTAFRTKYGLYEYLVMPFGLTNAPASFQRMINNVLRKNLDKFVVVYLDDILIFSETEEEHQKHVHEVLQTLQDAKLLVDPEKSIFHVQEVEFLGHIIRPNEVHMSPDKISAITEWPTPKTVKDVQSFVGLANYYRRFIKDFGKLAGPMTDLTRKDAKFEWTTKCQTAFEEIKNRVTSKPVLCTFDPTKPVELETDSSDFALGAQIGQRDDKGRLHPIAFYSYKLKGAELNYPIYDKEFLAIIKACKTFRHYLLGGTHKTKIYTDHKNISHFTTTQELNARQMRYAETLSEFDVEIIHRKGSENGRADALSRRSDYDTGKEIVRGKIFDINQEGNLVLRQLNAVFNIAYEHSHYDKILNWVEKNIQTDDDIPEGCTMENSRTPVYRDKIWIPTELRKEILKEIHEHPMTGHKGLRKTLEIIQRTYDYQGIKKDAAEVTHECDVCNKSKAARHKPYGELQPLPVAERPWETIALDFIVKLPESRKPGTKETYDSILVITDKFTKYGHFIPYQEASSAETLAYVFLQHIVANHGLPENIISDRGTTFTSTFWKGLMSQLGSKSKLSTAYHPQTDGQTERLNQTLEQYLRCYVNYEQNDWVQRLPVAQFAYNNSIAEATGTTPMYANYGMHPKASHEVKTGPLNNKAMLEREKMQSLHQAMKKELQFVNERMSKYYNRKRLKGPIFKRGDMVYLIRRNIRTTRPNDKLDFKKLGPFEVLEKISTSNYKLSLPAKAKIHPVFHVSLLEPAPVGARKQHHVEIEEEQEYEPEKILDSQDRNGEIHYLIKWKGYNNSENTWEPVKNLTNCQRLLRQYWNHQNLLNQ